MQGNDVESLQPSSLRYGILRLHLGADMFVFETTYRIPVESTPECRLRRSSCWQRVSTHAIWI
jgi:hypothetical protein